MRASPRAPLRRAAGELELGDFNHQVFTLRQKFVQRRIEQTDRDRIAFHLAVESDEVLLLQRQQLIEILFPLFTFSAPESSSA